MTSLHFRRYPSGLSPKRIASALLDLVCWSQYSKAAQKTPRTVSRSSDMTLDIEYRMMNPQMVRSPSPLVGWKSITIAEGISRASLSVLRWRNKMRMVAAATSTAIQIIIGAPAPLMPHAYDFEWGTQVRNFKKRLNPPSFSKHGHNRVCLLNWFY